MAIGGVGSSPTLSPYQQNNSPLELDQQADGQLAVNGQPVSSAEADEVLGQLGLKVTESGFTTVGGTPISSTNANVVSDFAGAPLPDIEGPMAPPADVQAQLGALDDAYGEGAGALMWLALSTMAKQSMLDMKSSKEIRNLMQDSKINAKKQSLDAAADKIAEDRAAAWEQLIFAGAAAAVSFMGNTGKLGDTVKEIGGQALSQVITTAGGVYSGQWGHGRASDEAELRGKAWDIEEAVLDQSIESSKANYEESKEQFKLAMRILSETSERQSQVVQKLTS